MTGFYYVTNQVFEMVVDSSISIISLYPIPSVQEIADNYKNRPYRRSRFIKEKWSLDDLDTSLGNEAADYT